MADKSSSRLFKPLDIGNGGVRLKHRVVLAPMTRNRGLPIHESTEAAPNRIWYPDELLVEFYSQRATDGGLLVTEGIPISLEVFYNYHFNSLVLSD
jgi:2,4-dienoyl-CoA reductase-like NADH-dependent reductase (Old Yellow Enzyme family)